VGEMVQTADIFAATFASVFPEIHLSGSPAQVE
jgi:hypothetical protein